MEEKIRHVWRGWEVDQTDGDDGILGSGSFGEVYRIRRTISGNTEYAALKVITIPHDAREISQLRRERNTDEQISSRYLEAKESFENEYATMARLRGHANIVYCDDIQFDRHQDGFGWDIHIKMELLTPMLKCLPENCSQEMTVKLGVDMCRALILCQKLGIVHRDIKPQNIFVSRDGNFKLGDFGIAKTMEGTQLGTVAGTQDYMAPEIAFFLPYSAQADIYSLGLVMYWMLNNYVGPFLPTDGTELTYSLKAQARTQRLSGTPLPAPLHGSEALKRIVLKACAFDQKQRYQTAYDMLTALLQLQSNSDMLFMPHDDDKTVVQPRRNTAAGQHTASRSSQTSAADATMRTAYTSSSVSPYSQVPPKQAADPDGAAAKEKVSDIINVLNKRTYDMQDQKNGKVSLSGGNQRQGGGFQSQENQDQNRQQSHPQRASVQPAAPKTADQLFEEKLKAFLMDSDAKLSSRQATSAPYSYVPPRQNTAASTGTASRQAAASTVHSGTPPRQTTGSAGSAPNRTAAGSTQGNTSVRSTPKPKKRRKKSGLLLLFLLVAACIAGFFIWESNAFAPSETIAQVPGDDYYSLLEVGYIDDPNGNLYMGDYVTDFYPGESEYVSWYTYKGEKPEGFAFTKVSYLGSGLYAAASETDDINSLSLITKEGEVLFSEEACIIEWASYQSESNPRYLLVYTADAETIDQENYLVSVEENYISTYHSQGTMYSGRLRAYDTFERRFVPNLPDVTDNEAMAVCGNNIVINTEDSTYVLYNAEGQPILELGTSSPTVCNGYLIVSRQGSYYIYDETGSQTYVANKFLSPVNRTAPYVELGTQVLDLYGNTILEGYNVTDYYGGLFEIRSEEDTYGLISPDGSEIVPCIYEYIGQCGNGYFYGHIRNQYSLLSKDGVLATDLDNLPYNLGIEKEEHLYVLNRRSYDLNVENRYYQIPTDALAAVQSVETGLYTVYDLFSGEPLLPYEYERVCYAAGYLYVYRDGGWGIFEVNLIQ